MGVWLWGGIGAKAAVDVKKRDVMTIGNFMVYISGW